MGSGKEGGEFTREERDGGGGKAEHVLHSTNDILIPEVAILESKTNDKCRHLTERKIQPKLASHNNVNSSITLLYPLPSPPL